MEKRCSYCGKSGNLSACKDCPLEALYCNRDCQSKAWPKHKDAHKLRAMRAVERMDDIDYNVQSLAKKALLFVPGSDIDVEDEQLAEIRFFGLLYPMKLSRCRVQVAASPLHGKGLFLTEDVKAQAILTFYPAHIIIKGGDVDYKSEEMTPEEKIREYVHHYKFTNDTMKEQISIAGSPERISDCRLLAHMANDAGYNLFAGVPLERLRDAALCRKLMRFYFMQVKKNANCALHWDKTGVVGFLLTLRALAMGTELLVVYGAVYWAQFEYGMGYAELHPFMLENIDRQESDVMLDVFLS